MSALKKLNEEFEKAIQAQVQERLEERDGQVIIVRKFPAPSEMPKELLWQRQTELQVELIKKANKERPQGQNAPKR